jgi:tRNA (cytidine/uridine-2'-O-)-methyltransferase
MNLRVVCFRPQIPQNVGNIGRTCVAYGVQKLHLVDPNFKIDDARAKRSGLDYWPLLSKEVHTDWPDFATAHELDRSRTFFFTKFADIDLHRLENPFNRSESSPVTLVFGAETTGLQELPTDAFECGTRVRIPMSQYQCAGQPSGTTPFVRSLNLSNAVAIAVYAFYTRWLTRDAPHKC